MIAVMKPIPNPKTRRKVRIHERCSGFSDYHPMKSCFLFVLAVICVVPFAQAGELKLEAQLVWATNDKESPDPKHKPVEASLVKKLQQLPWKWNNWFEVNRQKFVLPPKGAQTVSMSKECVIDVKDVGESRVEVTLIGKGKQVNKTTKPLPKGEVLIISGNSENKCAWFVVIKQAESK